MNREPGQVLCVDDDPDILEVAQLSLEAVGGFRVASAASGAEALTVAKRVQPDIILLDVMMPDMDGPTTLQALRAQPATARIPVVFMTARVQSSEVIEYLEQGAAGVIAKPFDPMTLSAQLTEFWRAADDG